MKQKQVKITLQQMTVSGSAPGLTYRIASIVNAAEVCIEMHGNTTLKKHFLVVGDVLNHPHACALCSVKEYDVTIHALKL